MKEKHPDLFGALLLSVFVHILLRSQTLFWTRTGLLAMLPGIAISALVGLLFAHCWPLVKGKLSGGLFGVLLAISAALEIHGLWQLYTVLYPDSVSLLGISLTVLIPVLYLRRISAVAQTGNVVLGLMVVAGVVLVLSVADRLRIDNLQTDVVSADNLQQALTAQETLYPELLLPALWPDREKRGSHTIIRLAILGTVFQTGVHLLLELFFGAGMPQAVNPVHQAARFGNLSIFDRLEWLQLIVWTMAVSVKLGLYLYAFTRLTGGKGVRENNLNGLPQFVLASGMWIILCMILKRLDLYAQINAWQTVAVWLFAIGVVLAGGVRWSVKICARK